MSKPLISVFLPTHARFKNGLLQKSIQSVLGQNYKNFEVFIVDDASTDGTTTYLQKIAEQDKRITLIRHEKNIGLLAATLAGAYLKSRGDFLAFAFDDTEWHPRHLNMLLHCFNNNPSAAMVYGGVSVQPPETKPMLLGSSGFDLAKLMKNNYLGHSGVMLRRSIVEQVGWLDPSILVKRTCDWDLWMRIGKKLPVAHCPEIVAVEKGVIQPDSLGMSVSWYDSLTRKYQQTDRDRLLTPDSIVEGKVPIFETLPWMNEDEEYQLQLLSFEHFIRTREWPRAIKIARYWLKDTLEEQKNVLVYSEIDILMEAFNLYLAETRYACKNTCSSAFKLHDLTDAYKFLEQKHSESCRRNDDLTKQSWQLDTQYKRIVNSLSWRITKPLREFRRIGR